ncbi:MAG TPA: helix-turn-helix domain-containing protein [Ornithinibacter sp.]|nr:helix-turn-helix domain-containing protein [Ornithinibacter sp.]
MDDPSYDGGVLLVLEEHLRRELDRIEERRRDLAASRELLSRVTSSALGATEPLSEPISDAIAPSVVNRLLAETSGMLRNFVLTISEGPALDESTMRANEDRIRRGEQQRAIYPASALSSPQGQRWMTVWGAVGEDQRIVPTTETEFAVFGETAVVALAAWDDPSQGYAVIRDPLVVRLYGAYFDLAWKHAVPAPVVGGREGTGDPRLVELLELGMKDEAIARHLGVSLRTVRRRVANLMAVNGVDTRFQLGWALARRRR